MFFEQFREAVALLPDGLIRPGPAAAPEAVAAAERTLGRPLPASFREFLLSFDGADLFHESVVIAGAGPDAPLALVSLNADAPVGRVDAAPGAAPELVFAETALGDRFAFAAAGTVLRLRAGSDERILSGSSFESWLAATIARERLLYGADGEFAPDAFEPDGEEVTPKMALRQAERALRQDPGSAEAEHERGTALRRLGRHRDAIGALTAATRLDPENPWPWFDLGRLLLGTDGDPSRAVEAFARAATLEDGEASARLLGWAARAAVAAGDAAAAVTYRRDATLRHPAIADELRRAADAAAAEGDQEAHQEAQLLLEAMTGEGALAPRRRLPVLTDATEPAVQRPPPPDPRHPPREPRRPRGGSRRGQSR